MSEPEPQPKAKTARDPQALTSEYHKARKQLMLWAGILFIWELVGIDLEKVKEAGGNAGAIITAIKSPQAVPWVLLILVAYFLFKTTIEWYQCSASRRGLRVSRIDFGSAWTVSMAAYALYLYQSIRRVQFADTVQSSTAESASVIAGTMGGALLAIGLYSTIAKKYRTWRANKALSLQRKDLLLPTISIVVIVSALIILRTLGWLVWDMFGRTLLAGAVLGVFMAASNTVIDLLVEILRRTFFGRKNTQSEQN